MAAQTNLPDFVLDENAVTRDDGPWRNGRAPDYSTARFYCESTRTSSHAATSLPDLVEKLVKNWEIEASHKTTLSTWRTVDHASYSVSVNGGPAMSGEHMISVGTYNALLAPSQWYCPVRTSFEASHAAFRQVLQPAFAWEVVDVYTGPPVVVFRWRHWGEMKQDYEGVNENGDEVKLPAHGRTIELHGVIVARVNESMQLQKVDVWYDPQDMFRQMAKVHETNGAGGEE